MKQFLHIFTDLYKLIKAYTSVLLLINGYYFSKGISGCSSGLQFSK